MKKVWERLFRLLSLLAQSMHEGSLRITDFSFYFRFSTGSRLLAGANDEQFAHPLRRPLSLAFSVDRYSLVTDRL
jgi:hypothetical protein